jgi:hypothetical protein
MVCIINIDFTYAAITGNIVMQYESFLKKSEGFKYG